MVEKKISRKELLKSPDEFLTFSEKVYEFIKTNSKQVVTGVIVAVMLILVVIGITSYRKYSISQAVTAYSKAAEALSSNQPLDDQTALQTVEKLEKFVADYSGTGPAHYALMDLGPLYFQLKDYKKAEKSLLAFLDGADADRDKHFKPAVLSSLAYIYEAQGDFAKAAARWEEVIALPGEMLKEEAYKALGRDYQALGENEKARKSYSTFLEKFPTSPDSLLAEAKLVDLAK